MITSIKLANFKIAQLEQELAATKKQLETCETVLATIYQMFPDVALAIDLAAQKARGE
jgi:hypothetical protein